LLSEVKKDKIRELTLESSIKNKWKLHSIRRYYNRIFDYSWIILLLFYTDITFFDLLKLTTSNTI